MSKRKICLDAGHYGKYNRSPVIPAYYESEMNWKLHLKLKAALEVYGFEVITTRADQAKDLGTINRGAASKGCDLFLSIHSNSAGSVKESVDYPLVIVQLDGKGDTLGKTLGKVIQETMGTSQAFDMWKKKNSSGQEAYGVLRGAASVGTMGMILEHSFHTQTRATQWLMVDSNLDKLAQAEAATIAAYFGMEKPTAKPETSGVRYRVQVGSYSDKANAEAQLAKLKAAGFDGYIVTDGTEPAPEKEIPDAQIRKGDVVAISEGAVYYNGVAVPKWVQAKTWIVRDEPVGDKAIIDKAADGSNAICSPISTKYLIKK